MLENGNQRGKFIVFEGIDGSGKSTQVRILQERLKAAGVYCDTTMEPTGSPIGSLIRQVLTGRLKMDKRVIASLFTADRLDHLLNDVNGILAEINQGITVISDRYYFSSYAYQGVDLPLERLVRDNEICSDILRPSLNIYIDISPDVAMERIAKNRFQQELFEKKAFLVQVYQKYREAFAKLAQEENVVIIDGNRSEQEVADEIWLEVSGLLS